MHVEPTARWAEPAERCASISPADATLNSSRFATRTAPPASSRSVQILGVCRTVPRVSTDPRGMQGAIHASPAV